MRLRRTSAGANRRRGIILLVVLVMLTLFAIAGLTFVLYAAAAAESARFNRDAETFAVSNAPDMDPATSFNLFMGQLVYGVPDPTAANPNSGSSALRGHSLAETMYGSYDSLANVPSDVPFNGTGRLSEPGLYSGTDGNQLVNYTYFQQYDPTFLRDPSRIQSRTGPGAARTAYTGGQNPPYTYADTNNMALASVSPTTGQVTMPSFLRAALFGPGAQTNPNWTNAQGKYMTLRPRPQEMGPSFPYPDPTTGCDVKNISSLPGGPDSIWMDVGAPELYTASGLRYKMMVAALVLDLDRCVNLNVHGNVFANGGLHAGNQGILQTEVNLSKVLDVNATEWQNVFLGNGVVTGRYGAGGLPVSVFGMNGSTPHAYAQIDFNGVNDPGQANPFTATPPWALPAGIGCFPSYPASGYGNATVNELKNAGGQFAHPIFYNPLNPTSPNRLLPLYSHAAMMYGGPLAAKNLDLALLCPNNFENDTASNITRRIYESTLLSMELDRPGVSPYVWDTTNPAYTLFYNPTTGKYTNSGAAGDPANDGASTAPSFPALSSRGATPANSDFDPRTWRSAVAASLLRADLDRQLAPYPTTGPNAGVQPPDRQVFANDIFTRLLAATGMTGVYNNLGSMTPPSQPQFLTLRWLAQFSANIVDYIDADDVMTEFVWTSPGNAAPYNNDTGIVFGTELPKLEINEVYLQYNNDPKDPFPKNAMGVQTASLPYQMNVYAELVNPLTDAADGNGPNNAVLVNGAGTPLYQLVLAKSADVNLNPQPSVYGANYPTGERRPENLVGDPFDVNQPNHNSVQPYNGGHGANTGSGDYTQPSQVLSVVGSLAGGPQSVTPMGATASVTPQMNQNQGYYVVGPSGNYDATVTPVSYQTPQATASSGTGLTYTVELLDPTANNPTPPTLLLQRLANPNLPYQPNIGAAGYNPYVTVDYVDMNAVQNALGATRVWNDARLFNNVAGKNGTTPVASRYSFGRSEPYAANALQFNQQTPAMATPGQPNDTFFATNTPGNNPTHWLTHMDRPLISPVELAGVSAFKPHELTQQFILGTTGSPTPYSQIAPWTDANTRLYRLLEFVKVKNVTPGIVSNGRVPGRINLDTVDSQSNRVFEALADAEPGNLFTQATADQVFNGAGGLVNQRPFLGGA
ncbi:MAG TPA: hypothetical protein VMS17_13040, partial [Gemmataceae bacterium]|nr:hypothetical protein [Gemmataceae bacterium]